MEVGLGMCGGVGVVEYIYSLLRQTLGGLQAVYNPLLNTSWIFLKEISSCGCVSTVGVACQKCGCGVPEMWVDNADFIHCGSGDECDPQCSSPAPPLSGGCNVPSLPSALMVRSGGPSSNHFANLRLRQ